MLLRVLICYFSMCFITIVMIEGKIKIRSQHFKPVVISKTRLDGDYVNKNTSSEVKSINECMLICSMTSNCYLGCLVKNIGCIISDVLVSPNYIEPETTDLYNCHTTLLQNNLVIGKTITGSALFADWLDKGVSYETAIDGLYDRSKFSLYLSDDINDSWALT